MRSPVFWSLLLLLQFVFPPVQGQGKADRLLKFIVEHPENSSLVLVRNGEVVVDFRSDERMNLASTMKVVVALAYAKQVTTGMLHPEEKVLVADLDRYYVPQTDGGAHPAWKKEQGLEDPGAVTDLREVARGMIVFSSNANTEYLLDRIGMERVEETRKNLGLEDHDPLQYLVSALLVAKVAFPGLEGKKLIRKMNGLSPEEYAAWTETIHQQLKNDSTGTLRNNPGTLDLEIQRIWSDRLPRSTTAEYARLVGLVNQGDYFPQPAQEELDAVLGWPMEFPGNSRWVQRLGMKGGSSLWVLTKVVYATDLEGNRTELAYFFNDLKPLQNMSLQGMMNDFEVEVLRNPDFRNQLKEKLNEKR